VHGKASLEKAFGNEENKVIDIQEKMQAKKDAVRGNIGRSRATV